MHFENQHLESKRDFLPIQVLSKSEPRYLLCNVSIHASPVVVAHSDVPLRTLISGYGCLAPPFRGGGPVLRNALFTGGVNETAPALRIRDTLRGGPFNEPQRFFPSRGNRVIVSRGSLQNIQPAGTQEMQISQLGLAARVSPVRGAHGAPPPRQERVAESHRGVSAVLAYPSTQSPQHPKAPKPVKLVDIRDWGGGGDTAKVPRVKPPPLLLCTNPKRLADASCLPVAATTRVPYLLSPACEAQRRCSLGWSASVSHV
jgi:hypothetical protein